jgi:hypothetical protein
MKDKVLKIVDQICSTESTDCRSLNKTKLARQLMDLADIPMEASIQEIPLDWDRQVEILYLLPNDTNYYALFAGIGTDGNYYFNLSVCGKLNGNEFDFYDTEVLVEDFSMR